MKIVPILCLQKLAETQKDEDGDDDDDDDVDKNWDTILVLSQHGAIHELTM